MFECPRYLLESVRKLMVRNGDLSLLSDYIVVGLGGGFKVLPELLEDVDDVSGYASTIRTYTGYHRGVRISAIAMGGGPSYAEWAVALAHMRKARTLIGVGWCGALQENIEIGDIVIPIATMRDEDTTTHYVKQTFPAVASPELVTVVAKDLRTRVVELGSKLWLGVTVSTSAMLAETPKRIEEWRKQRILCVDGETSTIYTLSYLAGIPALTMLAVSDNVILGKDCGFKTELSKRVDRVFRELVKEAFETIVRVHRAETL